jgi:hypothetical protein
VISDYWVFPSKEVPGKWALWIRGCGLDDLFDTASDARGAAAEDHLARMSGFTSAGPDPNAGPAGVRRGVPADALAGAPEPGAAKDPVAMETLEASPEMEP